MTSNHSLSGTLATRREALFVVILWLTACAYTVGYAALFAYREQPSPSLVLGMPSWVFWGVIAPWTVCTAITLWFSLRGIQDEDLGEERIIDEEAEAGR
jgi:hypothetical protein